MVTRGFSLYIEGRVEHADIMCVGDAHPSYKAGGGGAERIAASVRLLSQQCVLFTNAHPAVRSKWSGCDVDAMRCC